MNVTHVVENLNRGGLERMVLELVKLQQRQGDHCQVVCLYEEGAQAHELADWGIRVTACNKREGFDLGALARVRQAIGAHRTEVLHTHNAVAHYQATLASCALPLRRLINTRHGMGGNRRAARREWFYRRALLRTDTVVAVCEAARRDAIGRGIVPASKARVVPNGIHVQAFRPAEFAMRERLRRSLDLPEHARLIGHVGRLNWAKDQASLIRAFRTVQARQPDAQLLLVGDGELRAELVRCAADEGVASRVHFLGDRDDVPALLQGLDMFVLSSVSEGYSMALLEAAACALPIIATDVGGNSEIVHEGRTGLLVPAGEPARLAGAMLDLLTQPARAQELGHAARAWVEQHGSLEAMASRYARLYREGRSAS